MSDEPSVDAYAALRRDFPRAAIVPVHNEGLGGLQHRDKFAALGPNAATASSTLLNVREPSVFDSSETPSR